MAEEQSNAELRAIREEWEKSKREETNELPSRMSQEEHEHWEAKANDPGYQTTKVKILYFKRGGKFYSEADVVLGPPAVPDYEVPGRIKSHFEVGHFPGLTGQWYGFALVSIGDGVPRLIDCTDRAAESAREEWEESKKDRHELRRRAWAAAQEEPDYQKTRLAQTHRGTIKPGEAYPLGGVVPNGETQPVVVPWLEGNGIEIHDETANVVLTGQQAEALRAWLVVHYPERALPEKLSEPLTGNQCTRTWNGLGENRAAYDRAGPNVESKVEKLDPELAPFVAEAASYLESKTTKVYRVTYDGEDEIVEADSFGDALKVWRAALMAEFKREDCYEPDDEDREPDSVTLIADRPVLRHKIWLVDQKARKL